jgi:holin-like protein
MAYIRQFGIILLVTFIGEILNYVIPLPVPASIYGFIIMLLALKCRWIRLSQVQHTSEFLLGIMALLFVPAAVGLMDVWGLLQKILLPFCVITVATTILVMVVTGRVTQRMIKWERDKRR